MSNKAIIFDLDGTIYYGNKLINGVTDVLERIKQLNYEIIFFTNNSSKNREEVFIKLQKLGIETSLNKVYNSSYATAVYLNENKLKNIFLIGTSSFKKELSLFDINFVEPDRAEAVIVGLDLKFSYNDIAQGLIALQNGAKLIASNVDKNFSAEYGILKPGCNAIVASLIGSCSKKISPIIIGKPNTYMLEIICNEWKLTNNDIWVIGDREESDIAMAKNFGCKHILVGKNGLFIENIVERIENECFRV